MTAPRPAPLRFSIEPRGVPPVKAARRLGITLAEFDAKLEELRGRGFPPPDPTTGNYDLWAIDEWMSNPNRPQPALTPAPIARDAGAIDMDARVRGLRRHG